MRSLPRQAVIPYHPPDHTYHSPVFGHLTFLRLSRIPPLLLLEMARKSILSLLGLAAAASARKCQNLTVEVELSSRNGVFNFDAPSTNIDVTNFILDLSQQGANYSDSLLSGVSRPGNGTAWFTKR